MLYLKSYNLLTYPPYFSSLSALPSHNSALKLRPLIVPLFIFKPSLKLCFTYAKKRFLTYFLDKATKHLFNLKAKNFLDEALSIFWLILK